MQPQGPNGFYANLEKPITSLRASLHPWVYDTSGLRHQGKNLSFVPYFPPSPSIISPNPNRRPELRISRLTPCLKRFAIPGTCCAIEYRSPSRLCHHLWAPSKLLHSICLQPVIHQCRPWPSPVLLDPILQWTAFHETSRYFYTLSPVVTYPPSLIHLPATWCLCALTLPGHSRPTSSSYSSKTTTPPIRQQIYSRYVVPNSTHLAFITAALTLVKKYIP